MRKLVSTLLSLLITLIVSPLTSAGEAYLTRFGPMTYARGAGDPQTRSASFNAVDGQGSLVLRGDGSAGAEITVNGSAFSVDATEFGDSGRVVLPLRLASENMVDISVVGEPDAELQLRVNQFTTADINVRALMYFGINTTDMDRQRAFYSTLGLNGEIFPAGPEECRSFAQSLGFKDNYRIFVALTSFNGAPPWIDTVEFRDLSLRDDLPYRQLNHVGMAYATYATTDLDGDYRYLQQQGVEFVSFPTTAPNGERFVFLKDQDGTFLKLIEEEGERTAGPDLTRLVNTNMNVTDLQRSRQFYRLLGFTETSRDVQQGSGAFSVAHGFDISDTIAFQGIDVSLPGTDLPLPAGGDPEATLQLREWQTPYNDAPPYWPPVNHLGIDRIAFYVDDLNATIAEMNRLGYEQVGPIGGGAGVGDVGIVFFYDPDGIKVEFWGPVSEPNPDSAC